MLDVDVKKGQRVQYAQEWLDKCYPKRVEAVPVPGTVKDLGKEGSKLLALVAFDDVEGEPVWVQVRNIEPVGG